MSRILCKVLYVTISSEYRSVVKKLQRMNERAEGEGLKLHHDGGTSKGEGKLSITYLIDYLSFI